MSEMAYIGVAPCECVFAVTVDAGRREDMAHTLGEWIADGGHVERLTVDQARERFTMGKCPHDPQWGGMDDGDARLFAGGFNRDMIRIAQDAAWDVTSDERNHLVSALAKLVPDAPESWWEDLGERVEQAFIDILRVLPKPKAQAVASTEERP